VWRGHGQAAKRHSQFLQGVSNNHFEPEFFEGDPHKGKVEGRAPENSVAVVVQAGREGMPGGVADYPVDLFHWPEFRKAIVLYQLSNGEFAQRSIPIFDQSEHNRGTQAGSKQATPGASSACGKGHGVGTAERFQEDKRSEFIALVRRLDDDFVEPRLRAGQLPEIGPDFSPTGWRRIERDQPLGWRDVLEHLFTKVVGAFELNKIITLSSPPQELPPLLFRSAKLPSAQVTSQRIQKESREAVAQPTGIKVADQVGPGLDPLHEFR
jgi:hypothetical protein